MVCLGFNSILWNWILVLPVLLVLVVSNCAASANGIESLVFLYLEVRFVSVAFISVLFYGVIFSPIEVLNL